MDCFEINMTREQLMGVSSLALAHVGDAVYELLVRAALCSRGIPRADTLHRMTVSHVAAPAQAEAAGRLLPMLTDEEKQIYKRGRNTHVQSVPRGASAAEYHAATGLEALFGWLYMNGQRERLDSLFRVAFGG